MREDDAAGGGMAIWGGGRGGGARSGCGLDWIGFGSEEGGYLIFSY